MAMAAVNRLLRHGGFDSLSTHQDAGLLAHQAEHRAFNPTSSVRVRGNPRRFFMDKRKENEEGVVFIRGAIWDHMQSRISQGLPLYEEPKMRMTKLDPSTKSLSFETCFLAALDDEHTGLKH